MKPTGDVRKVDRLGRITIPKRLARELNISVGDPIEILVDNEYIVLKKLLPKCYVTGELTTEYEVIADGKMVLSPEGAKVLLEQLKQLIKD